MAGNPLIDEFVQDLDRHGEHGPRLEKIERVKELSVEAFRRVYATRGKPVVVRGAADAPAWTWGSLTRDYGRLRVGVRQGRSYDTMDRKHMHLAEYLTTMLGGRQDYYLANNPLPPQMHHEFRVPRIASERYQMSGAQIWIGGGSTGAHLHRDLVDNFVALVIGGKQFVLASPLDTSRLYARRVHASLESSEFDAIVCDYEAFPAAQDVRFYSVRLRPNDLLYIPCGWWHQTRNVGATCSVNFFSRSSVEALPAWHARLGDSGAVVRRNGRG